MRTVDLSRLRRLALAATAAAALAAPAAASADGPVLPARTAQVVTSPVPPPPLPPAPTPVPTPAPQPIPAGRSEAVTIKSYMLGRTKPSRRARAAARLWTNTGFSNRRAIYPVVAHRTLANRSEWLRVKTIEGRRQMQVWIPRRATRRVWVDYSITIDLSSRRATIYNLDKVVKRFRVVVGARSTPTPTGSWFVVDHLRLHTSWAPGKWALATSAFSRVLKRFEGGLGEIALHARGYLTAPLGTAASHGCVRFADSAATWMATHVPNGTPILIKK